MVTGFVGARSAFSLASRASFDFVIDHDSMAEPAANVLVAGAKNSDLLVSIQNAYGAQLAADVGIPCAYVDTLFWMWPDQALAIPTHRQSGFACLDWDSFYSLDGLTPTEEEKASRRIAECVARFELDGPARSRLVERLRWALAEDELSRVREAQTRFIKPFAERGASNIGRYILDCLARLLPRLAPCQRVM